MTSSTNIPHIYSKGDVSNLDWNTYFTRKYHTEQLDTTTDSPYNADFTYEEFEIDANSADFEFNLPALSTTTHPDITNFKVRYRITCLDTSSYNVNVNPNGTDKLRGSNTTATLLPGETIDIESLPGSWQ